MCSKLYYCVCCFPCRYYHCCWLWDDKDFPPNRQSIGKIAGDSASKQKGKTADEVIWLRATEIRNSKPGTRLFTSDLVVSEIAQGQLGNCWLISALGCLAEHPVAISRLFVTKEWNPTGKYCIILFDGQQRKWVKIRIDDYIPCDRKKWENTREAIPAFANGGEQLWVMLIEKAFAKFCGSYAALEGGWTTWALRAMTGDLSRRFLKESNGKWKRVDLLNINDPSDKKKAGFYSNPEDLVSDDLYTILYKYYRLKSVLCCSGASGKQGLVSGHAYTILSVMKVGDFRMIQIRNPWGRGEWSGPWCDGSPLWTKNADVARAAEGAGKKLKKNDGVFWMQWKDFVNHWEHIGVTHRTIDIRSLTLEVKGDSVCAPFLGCVAGCAQYWFCCEGACRLYCAENSDSKTVELNWCDRKCKCCYEK